MTIYKYVLEVKFNQIFKLTGTNITGKRPRLNQKSLVGSITFQATIITPITIKMIQLKIIKQQITTEFVKAIIDMKIGKRVSMSVTILTVISCKTFFGWKIPLVFGFLKSLITCKLFVMLLRVSLILFIIIVLWTEFCGRMHLKFSVSKIKEGNQCLLMSFQFNNKSVFFLNNEFRKMSL